MIRIVLSILGIIIPVILNALIEWKIITYDMLLRISNTKVTFNILLIFTIASSLYFIKILFEKKFDFLILIFRARRLNNLWLNFKKILIKYSTTNDDKMQASYSATRNKLVKLYSYFSKDIHGDLIYTSSTDKQRHNFIIRNLEHTFYPTNILQWRNQVHRTIPEELDCFDAIFIRPIEINKRKLIKHI